MTNPLIYRGICANTRPGKLVFRLGLLSVLVLLVWLFHHMSWVQASWGDAGRDYAEAVLKPLGLLLLGGQYVVGFLVIPITAAEALPTERLRKSEEFFTTLPISAASKTVGLLVGPNVLWMMLAAVLTIPVVALLLAADIPLAGLIWSQVLLWSGGISFALVGLLVGGSLGKRTSGWGMMLLLLLLGGMLGAAALEDDFSSMPAMAYAPTQLVIRCLELPSEQGGYFSPGGYHVFSLSVPWQFGPLAMHILVGVVGFAAGTQRLRRPSAPPLPRWGSLVFFAALHLLFLGFLADTWREVHRDRDQSSMVTVYAFSWLTLLFFWAVTRCPSMQQSMEWMGKGGNIGARLIGESLTDPRVPGYVALVLGWGLTVVTIWLIDWLYWGSVIAWGHGLWVMVTWGLFLVGYHSVVVGTSLSIRRKAGPSIGVIFVLLLLGVPLLFSALPTVEEGTRALTPFADGLEIYTKKRLARGSAKSNDMVGPLAIAAVIALLATGFAVMRLVSLSVRAPRGRSLSPA